MFVYTKSICAQVGRRKLMRGPRFLAAAIVNIAIAEYVGKPESLHQEISGFIALICFCLAILFLVDSVTHITFTDWGCDRTGRVWRADYDVWTREIFWCPTDETCYEYLTGHQESSGSRSPSRS